MLNSQLTTTTINIMKYIIREDRISNLVTKFLQMKFGHLVLNRNRKKNSFFWTEKDSTFPVFELNDYGTLWIPDDLLREISKLFNFDVDGDDDNYDVKQTIIDSWEQLYGLRPKRVNIYFNI
jgi:hypothetical protein